MLQLRLRSPKTGRTARLLPAVILSLLTTLSLNAQSAPAVPSAAPPAVTAAFSEVRAQRTTVAGEYLLRIAEAAYGNKLLWPLVWVFNAQSLPDPEKVPLGSRLTVARLERELTDPLVVKALDEAYRLVWQQYARVHAGDRDKSRWILGQAAEAGVDVTSSSWSAVLGEEERAFVKTLKVVPLASVVSGALASPRTDPSSTISPEGPGSAVPAETATTAGTPAGTSASSGAPTESLKTKAQQEKFLTDVLAGTPLTGPEMEAFAQVLGTAEGASLLARLEEASQKPDAPPHVAYVLALHYGRQGMKAQEYRALVQARTQADRRPDLIFNLLLVNGRMALLKADRSIEEVLPATLTVLTEPSGATVTVAGEVWGITPLTKEGLRPGTYEVMLTKEGYQLSGQAVTLDLGERREVRGDLRIKDNSFNDPQTYSNDSPNGENLEQQADEKFYAIKLNSGYLGGFSFGAGVEWKFHDFISLNTSFSWGMDVPIISSSARWYPWMKGFFLSGGFFANLKGIDPVALPSISIGYDLRIGNFDLEGFLGFDVPLIGLALVYRFS